jgi:multidrug transporter EmrE-like cation transporter
MALFRHVLSGRITWQGSVSLLVKNTFALLAQPLFLLGFLVLSVSILLWLVVLATQKLSVAYPVQIGLVTLFSALVALFVFKEAIPPRAMVGYGMLLAGVVLIFR